MAIKSKPKRYVWHIWLHDFTGNKWVFIRSFTSGATEKTAYNDFRNYQVESLEDGNYGVVRHIPDKNGKRPTIFTSVNR